MVRARRRRGGLGWLILPLLLSIYLLSFRGIFQADDEHIFAARAQSMALRADLEAPQVYGNARVRQLQLWGDQATEVEPALSLLGAAFYWLAARLGWGGLQLMFTINLYAVAGTAFLVFHTCRLLSMEDRFALITALGFGLTTFAMPYALTLYRDPLAMLMAALGFYGLAILLSSVESGKYIGVVWIGVALVGGSLTKNTTLAMIPALIGGWLIYARFEGRPISSHSIKSFAAGSLLLLVISFILPSTGPLARLSADYYLDLTSHFLSNFNAASLIAMVGPWISPAKSIFLFAPMLILAFVPLPGRKEILVFQITAFGFAVLLGMAQALFYGTSWHGGYGWGLRFMLPALPPLAVATSYTIRSWWQARGWKRIIVVSLLIVGFLMQQSASWIPWRWAYQQMQSANLDPLSEASAWSLKAFAPAWQLSGLFSWEAYNTAWLNVLWQNQPLALLVPISSVVLVPSVLLVLALKSTLGHAQLEWLKKSLVVIALAAPILAIGFIGGDPSLADDKDHFHAGIEEVTAVLAEGDVVVMDAYGTPLWHFMMNRWGSPNAWYSLPYEVPSVSDLAVHDAQPAAASLNLFRRLLTKGAVLHYLTTSDVPDFALSREIDWLRANSRQLEIRRLEGEPSLYIYSFQND